MYPLFRVIYTMIFLQLQRWHLTYNNMNMTRHVTIMTTVRFKFWSRHIYIWNDAFRITYSSYLSYYCSISDKWVCCFVIAINKLQFLKSQSDYLPLYFIHAKVGETKISLSSAILLCEYGITRHLYNQLSSAVSIWWNIPPPIDSFRNFQLPEKNAASGRLRAAS